MGVRLSGGSGTSHYYGASVELLERYARYAGNSREHAWACGSLLPNDLGLFDMLGNVVEWCHDVPQIYHPDRKWTISDDVNTFLSCG